jgi:WD40 repeat protein
LASAPKTSLTSFHLRAFIGSAVWMLICIFPCLSMAQGPLPIQWMYSPVTTSVQCVAYSPDGTLMAVSGKGGIQIYTVSTGVLLRCLPTSAQAVLSLAFSSDGKTLASGGSYNEVELWNVSTGILAASFSTTINQGVNSVALSPDGTMLADGGQLNNNGIGVLEVWSLKNGALIESLPTIADNGVTSLAFSPDSKTIADGGYSRNIVANGGVLELWSVSAGQDACRRRHQLVQRRGIRRCIGVMGPL